MKSVILLITTLVSSASFAAAISCPAPYTAVANCKSTPTANDSTLASEWLDFITVCSFGKSTVLALEKNGQVKSSPPTVTTRAGRTTFMVDYKDISFKLSIVTATMPESSAARFSVIFKSQKNLSASSTYTCSWYY